MLSHPSVRQKAQRSEVPTLRRAECELPQTLASNGSALIARDIRHNRAVMENTSNTAAGRAGTSANGLFRLFFTNRGRLSRGKFWLWTLVAWAAFWMVFFLLDGVGPIDLTRIPAAILLWALLCLCSKRYHDLDRSSVWLLLLLIPLFGLAVVVWELGFRRGSVGENAFGGDPRDLDRYRGGDYATVA